MPEHVHHIVKRLILYICICLLAGIGISGMTAFFHTSFSSTSLNIISAADQFPDGFSYYHCLFYGHEILEQQAASVPYSSLFRVCLLSAADAWHAQQLSGLAYLQSGPGR